MNNCFRSSALITLAAAALLPVSLSGAVATTSSTHVYKIGDANFEGYIARPAELAEGTMVPGVLVVHDWMGDGEFSHAKADHLASLGYVAFAVDMYGQGVRAADQEEAPKLAGVLYNNPSLFRERITAALEELKQQPGVDASRLGAIGFCFGGTTVLELARSGAEVRGVVSFHGGLKPFSETTPESVKARIMILHGVLDPFVPPADVAACMDDLNKAGAYYQLIGYPNAVHSFTNPNAGNDLSKGQAYNPMAERGAFAAMEAFFRGLFAQPKPAAPAAQPAPATNG